jgi:hypothetical protein
VVHLDGGKENENQAVQEKASINVRYGTLGKLDDERTQRKTRWDESGNILCDEVTKIPADNCAD